MKLAKLGLGLSTMALGLALAVAPAGAQTYQPGNGGGSQTQSSGTHVAGETFSASLCGFQPNQATTISVDGQNGPAATADSRGCVAVTATILSNSSVRVNGVTFAATCGGNSIVASAGSTTSTDTFSINCASTATGGTGTGTRATSGGAATPTRSTGGLAFTGANVMKVGGAGLVLVLFGAGIVALERRKSRLQG